MEPNLAPARKRETNSDSDVDVSDDDSEVESINDEVDLEDDRKPSPDEHIFSAVGETDTKKRGDCKSHDIIAKESSNENDNVQKGTSQTTKG
jgi:hypothetical protein